MRELTPTPRDSGGAETATLGAILMDRDAIREVTGFLKPEHFQMTRHQEIYRAALACQARDEPPDIITVTAELEAAGAVADAGDVGRIMLEFAGTAVHVEHYARRVLNAARLRTLVAQNRRAEAECAANPDLDPLDANARTAEAILGDSAFDNRKGPVLYADLMARVSQRITQEHRGEIDTSAITSGFPSVDALLGGGFRKQGLVVLAARSSMGKTALAASLTHAAATKGQVILFSAEMDDDSVARRVISQESRIPFHRIAPGMTDQEYDDAMRAADAVSALPIWVDDTSGITTDQMIVRTQRIKRQGPVELVIFDYTELAGDEAGRGGDDQRAKMAKVITKLKHLARICDVAVIALSQVSRAVESRANHVPTMADLPWSSAAEATADMVLFLYRHDYYVDRGMEEEDYERRGTIEVHVAKNRNGAIGHTALGYEPATFRFFEINRPF